MKKLSVVLLLVTGLMAGAVGCGAGNQSQDVAENSMVMAMESTSSVVSMDSQSQVIAAEAVEMPEEEMIGDEGIPEGTFIPESFLDEITGKNKYDSMDEIIASLPSGCAYAIVKIAGTGEEVILITDGTYDFLDGVNDHVTIEASAYSKRGETYEYDTVFLTGGTADPIAIDDEGYIYTAAHHEIGKFARIKNDVREGIIYVYSLSEIYNEEAEATYSGFVCDIEADETEFVDGDKAQKLFEEKYEEYLQKAKPINFTVVE